MDPEKLVAMLTQRAAYAVAVNKLMDNTRLKLEDPEYDDTGEMEALQMQLVTVKDEFTKQHERVTDQMPPEDKDLVELHKNADALEKEVSDMYDEMSSWMVKVIDDRREQRGLSNIEPEKDVWSDEGREQTGQTDTTYRGAEGGGQDNQDGTRKKERKGSTSKSEVVKANAKALVEIKEMLQLKTGEFGRMEQDWKEGKERVAYLEDQREKERRSFLEQIAGLEREIATTREARGYSTPAYDSLPRSVTFNDRDMSNVYQYGVSNVDPPGARRTGGNDGRVNSVVRGNSMSNAPPPQPNTSPRSILDRTSGPEVTLLTNLVSQNNTLVQSVLHENRARQDAVVASRDLPRTKLQTFDGNPLNYWSFIKNFDDMVGGQEVRAAKKLNTLINHCEEDVAKLIVSCQLLTSERGYNKARSILRLKYGNPFIISQAWKNKFAGYPKLMAPELLEVFTEELVCCSSTLKEMGYGAALESVESLSTLVSKLPNNLRGKWRRKHQQAIADGRAANIDDLLQIVKAASDEANDALYNDTRLDQIHGMFKVKPESQFVTKKSGLPFEYGCGPTSGGKNRAVMLTAFEDKEDVVQLGEEFEEQISIMLNEFSTKKCHVCPEDHYTSVCPVYLSKTPKERLEAVRASKLCLLCLGTGHFITKCRQKWRCQEKGCIYRHHNTLHGAFTLENKRSAAVNAMDKEAEREEEGLGDLFVNTTLAERETIIFKTVTLKYAALPLTPVVVRCQAGEFVTYGLLDCASNSTICTSWLIEAIGAPKRGLAKLTVNTVMGKNVTRGTIHNFEIRGVDRAEYYPVFDAVAVKDLPIASHHILTAEDLAEYPYLEELGIPTVEARHVGILVGQDNAHLLKPGETVDGPEMRDPFGVPTPLGWTVYGFRKKPPSKVEKEVEINMMATDAVETQPMSCDVDLEEAVAQFWDVDKVPERKQFSSKDKGILEYWEKNIRLVDGHIEIPIPFKTKHPQFPDNRAAAVMRLKGLGKRMEKDQELCRQMRDAMQINFDKGYAERVVDPPLPGLVWNMTCFPVFHHRKPGIARPVFNGKWKYKEVSLNDMVETGPDLNNRLVDVLVNFRVYRVAFTADIKAMFNQVRVPEEQRDVLRFLWFEDGDPTKAIVDYRMRTHIFGGKWCPSVTTFSLRKVPELIDEEVEDEIVETINRGFYVDDCLKSVAEIARGIMQLSRMRAVLGTASFELTKVASNCPEIVNSVPESDRAKGFVSLELDGGRLHLEHSLGQGWRPVDDVFVFTVEFKLDPATRREMLSTLSSLFDPLGLCGPVLLPGKRLFQELSKRGLNWDDAIPDDVLQQWVDWARDAKNLEQLKIPRWLGLTHEKQRARIVHFSDASEKAYGCVSYLCGLGADGGIISAAILMARCKLAPMKTLSIPRLELCGAHMAAKTDEVLRGYLDVELEQSYFWTDSYLVLRYVSSEPCLFKTFVANRVSDILQITKKEQWYFVPGTLNPADVLSRGTTAQALVADETWKSGPDYLVQNQEEWPPQPDFLTQDLPENEVKREKKIYSPHGDVEDDLFATEVEEEGSKGGEEETPYDVLGEIVSRCSWWMRTVRLLARVMIAVEIFKGNHKRDGSEPIALEIKEAGQRIMRYAQEKFLTTEERESTRFKKLSATMRDGLFCVGGRLQRSSFPSEFNHPYVLAGGNRIADMYILHCHNQVFHAGVDRTLMEVRKEAWLTTGRRGVKPVLKDCLLCKKMKAKPMTQFMADLPYYRLESRTRPFKNVGVDYLGPLQVKIGRSDVKRWVCVITCSVTRAVHIEPAADLSSSGFLNAFMRFMARRGRPENVLSDNGTNFVGAKAEIEKSTVLWNKQQVERFCTDRGISWKFNPPGASHFGGFWERQMRTFRNVFYSLAKAQRLTDDLLHTFICLAEHAINSRPMTKMSEDPGDPSPLTPNHLLMMSAIDTTVGVYTDRDVYRKTWKHAQVLADKFWERWTQQYVMELQRRSKWYEMERNLEIGDLVLLRQETTPRQHWPLGLVVKTSPGADGLVRSADVRTQAGTYTRPVAKMVLLEADFVKK